MTGPFPLAAGLAIGATIGYGRIRRTFPVTDLPLRLRVKAALTMPPMSDRLAMAAASIGGQAVVSNVNIRGQVEVPAGHVTFRNVRVDNSEVEELRAEVRRLNRLSAVQGARESKQHWKGIARSERTRRKELEEQVQKLRGQLSAHRDGVVLCSICERVAGTVAEQAPASVVAAGIDPDGRRCRGAGGHHWIDGDAPRTWHCAKCPATIAASGSGPDTEGTVDA